MHRHRGFTLIELLVVVAIIALIAAILFPVFAQAREKARQAACLSNVKQLSMGIYMYAQDYDEYLPYNYAFTWPGQQYLTWWHDHVRPYVKSEQIYLCPSATSHTIHTGLANPNVGRRPPGAPNPLILDYVANTGWGFDDGDVFNGIDYSRHWNSATLTAGQPNVEGPFINNWNNASKSLALVEDPAGTIGIFDARPGYNEIWRHRQTDAYFNASGKCAWSWSNDNASRSKDDPICQSGHVEKRHLGGYVVGFMDGHAKWIKNSTPGMWTNRAND